MDIHRQYRALLQISFAFNLDQTVEIIGRFDVLRGRVLFAGGSTRCGPEKLGAVIAFADELVHVVRIARYEVPREDWQWCLDNLCEVDLVVEYLGFLGRADDAEWVTLFALSYQEWQFSGNLCPPGQGRLVRRDGEWWVVERLVGEKVSVGGRVYVAADLSTRTASVQHLVEVTGEPSRYQGTSTSGDVDDRSHAKTFVRFRVKPISTYDPEWTSIHA